MSGPRRVTELALRAVSMKLSRLPGSFPLIVDPVHAQLYRGERFRTAEVLGAQMRLDVSEYTQRRIYYSAFEHSETVFVRSFLRRGDTFIDVGAHAGLYSILAAARVGPAGAVHAFEPLPQNLERLEENVSLNGFRNVRVNGCAVGAERGETSLGNADTGQGSTGQFTIGGDLDARRVPITTLDDYCAECGLTSVRILKIDAEGYEAQVLRGAQRLLESGVPDAIVFEVNKPMLERHGSTAGTLGRILAERGYTLHSIASDGKLKPLAKLRLDALPRRREHRDGFLGTLRAGLAERNQLFNVVALGPQHDA